MCKLLRKLFWVAWVCFTLSTVVSAQSPGELWLSGGWTFLNSAPSDRQYVKPGIQFSGGYNHFLGKLQTPFSLGLQTRVQHSIGGRSTTTIEPLLQADGASGLLTELNQPYSQSLTFLGAGPLARLRIGKSLQLTAGVIGGLNLFKQDSFAIVQRFIFGQQGGTSNTFSKEVLQQSPTSSSAIGWLPTARINWMLNQRISLWAEANYFLSDYKARQRELVPLGTPDASGVYKIDQILRSNEFRTTERTFSLNHMQFNVGLGIHLGKVKTGSPDASPSQPSPRPAEMVKTDKKPKKTDKPKPSDQSSGAPAWNTYEHKPLPVSTDVIAQSAVADILVPQQQQQQQQNDYRIVLVAPLKQHFEDIRNLKEFRWKIAGQPRTQPDYTLEIAAEQRMPNGQTAPVLIYRKEGLGAAESWRTDENFYRAVENSKQLQFTWRVIDRANKKDSETGSFSRGSCNFNLETTIDSIRCLGFRNGKFHYKICFSAKYEAISPQTPLTFNQAGSGLFITQTNGASFPPGTITNQTVTPALTPQGPPYPNTKNYCLSFEAPPSVTDILLTFQGDNLLTPPAICRPGVQDTIKLEACRCKDCDRFNAQFNLTGVSQASPSAPFKLTGNFVTNANVRRVNMTVTHMSFTDAQRCSNGVTNHQTAGVFINSTPFLSTVNSQAVTLLEAAPANGAAKSLTAQWIVPTMNIPVQLHLGLPVPFGNVSAECCPIKYKVCFKAEFFIDNGNGNFCTRCVREFCVEFSNVSF